MCGIAGFVGRGDTFGAFDPQSVARKMVKSISHRGPDASGIWVDRDSAVVLAHSRLSVLDLSEAGSQPMSSRNSRYMICYNGEIYNHQELRELAESRDPSIVWRGHSDTEVLLAMVELFGLSVTLEKLVGMFAFALWDKEMREMTLARDRAGEKPLYFGKQGSGCNSFFLFASELKAIRAHPNFSPEIDQSSLSMYFEFGQIGSPRSIYKGIKKLPPGTIVRLRPDGTVSDTSSYWTLEHVVQKGLESPFCGDEREAVDQTRGMIEQSILGQLAADVPVGALLSGGVDSSLIVALAQRLSSRPLKTFSVGFDNESFDETRAARSTAAILGTDHTEVRVSGSEALGMIPKLATIYDEPFSDASQIPTLLVAKAAREHVTVALTGDAGDELFFGYDRHRFMAGFGRKIRSLPRPIRRLVAVAGQTLPRALLVHALLAVNRINSRIGRPSSVWSGSVGAKINKVVNFANCDNQDDLYRVLLGNPTSRAALAVGVEELAYAAPPKGLVSALFQQDVSLIAAMDFCRYLPDTVLTKVDRALMSVSLETRIPFLDHRLIEFAWTLPEHLKIRNGTSKWILRTILSELVSGTLSGRPKFGFTVPLDDWMRGPLKDWVEDLISPTSLDRQGFLNAGVVEQIWRRHLGKQENNEEALWTILMFQSWLQSEKLS